MIALGGCLINLRCLNLLNSIRRKISSLPLDIWHRRCSSRRSQLFWNNHWLNRSILFTAIISCNLSTRQTSRKRTVAAVYYIRIYVFRADKILKYMYSNDRLAINMHMQLTVKYSGKDLYRSVTIKAFIPISIGY